MYPEKPKRDQEKPKRRSQVSRQAPLRFLLVLLIFTPALIFITPRLDGEQFIDMAMLTIMITTTIYIVYHSLLWILDSALNSGIEDPPDSDSPVK